MSNQNLTKTMEAVRDYSALLEKERRSRPTGLHADDKRIAAEIAGHQFDLARFTKEIREQNERWRTATERNIATIKELETIFASLQAEMDIALHRAPALDLWEFGSPKERAAG